jgi:hypothetical protein
VYNILNTLSDPLAYFYFVYYRPLLNILMIL